ncbi:MAG: restriction endonuclease [Sphingopyxis sp.]
MIDRFQAEAGLSPQDAEQLIVSVLRASGHDVTESGFVGGDAGVDCYFDTEIDCKKSRIAVEIKHLGRPVQRQSVEQALQIAERGNFDRAWVVSRSGFSHEALNHADGIGAGIVDLFGPDDLRNWIARHAQHERPESSAASIIRKAMHDLALQLAASPDDLKVVEWRDLERILREVFEGFGFNTRLTRPGKDGGLDLELTAKIDDRNKTFLVEVKHWAEQKPGASHLTKLIRISVEREADGAVLLSSSGFTRTISSGLLELGPPIHLGDGGKIISLCKTYYRLSTGYWLEEPLPDTLYSGTKLVQR